jgi:CubicO group peptidase (beta-lactamase class C family)
MTELGKFLILFICIGALFDWSFSLQKVERNKTELSKDEVKRLQQHSYDWPTSTPEAQGLNSDIFLKASEHAKQLGFVDSLLVVRNGYLISENYYNGYDKDTPHIVASASKTFTGALVGIAKRENLLTLDQKLVDFFPEYVTPLMDPRKNQITVRHLLQMLAGFWDVDTMQSSNRIRYAIEHLPIYDDPGKSWFYGTVGANLLSGIITRVSGMSTFAFAQTYLFEPIGITVSAWKRDPAGIYVGGYGMQFTPRNMARFGYLYIQKGWSNGLKIIPDDYLHEGWTRSTPSFGMLPHDAVQESGYGYLWWIAKMGDYWTYLARGHGGQHILVVPELDMVVVLTGKALLFASFHHVANFRLSSYLILNPIRDWRGEPPYSPVNAHGAKHANRSLFQREYIIYVYWEASPRNQIVDIVEYRIYKIISATKRELIRTFNPGTFEFRQEGSDITEESEHIYGITSVSSDGKESIPAYVIIYEAFDGESQ